MAVLTIGEVKEFLEIGHAVQDTTVQSLIDGIEDFTERQCGIKLVSASRTEDHAGGSLALRPDVAPVTSVTKLERLSSDGTLETVDATLYRLERNRIIRWDRARWDRDTVYRVTFTGGFSTVPDGLKHAMLQLVRRYYDNRGGKQQQAAQGFGVTWMNFSASDAYKLLRPYVATGFVG